MAIGPLAIVLAYLSAARKWSLNFWQRLGILMPLIACLGVGLIVSLKIGGAGDLHNMDMFMLGILFAGAIAWKNGGHTWTMQLGKAPRWIQVVVLLMLIIPGLGPLMKMRPIEFADYLPWLTVLTGGNPYGKTMISLASGKTLISLASDKDAKMALENIRSEVALAQTQGEVLFMDQRQLLTFGYIQNVPLVPEFEKKYMMNEAMAGNAAYFKTYYHYLANKRFSLIVTEPLVTQYQSSTHIFGEENDAWVYWVSVPTLCFYEPVAILDEVGVELLIPRQDTKACAHYLNP